MFPERPDRPSLVEHPVWLRILIWICLALATVGLLATFTAAGWLL